MLLSSRAKAQLFPTITLTGDFGGESKALAGLFTVPGRIWTFAAGLSAPIFEGMLPRWKAGTRDVVTVRGITYRVTPLAGRWDGTPSPTTPKTLLLLCGYRGQHRGFTVDHVLGLTEVAPRRIRSLPPHFAWLQEAGGLTDRELRRTFNCGVGLVLVADPAQADACLHLLAQAGEAAFVCGELAPA